MTAPVPEQQRRQPRARFGPKPLIALALAVALAVVTVLEFGWLSTGSARRSAGNSAAAAGRAGSPAVAAATASSPGVGAVPSPGGPTASQAPSASPRAGSTRLAPGGATSPVVPAVAARSGRGTGVPGVAPAPPIDRLLAPGRFAYLETVKRLARKHSVEYRLVLAIIASESGGDPHAISSEGAIGLMQLTPDTAARLGVDPWDPEQNIEGAVRYLASLLSRFRSQDLSLIAYNAGPGFASRYRRGEVELGAETRAFLIRVGRLLQPKHAQQ